MIMHHYELFTNHHKLLVKKIQIKHLAYKLQSNQYFSFPKINHAFWQVLLKEDPWYTRSMKYQGEEFIQEITSIIRKFPTTDEFIFGISCEGPPGIYYGNCSKIADVISSLLPPKLIPTIGTIWKEATINKNINIFFDVIKEKRVIIVGLEHLKECITNLKLKNAFHFLLLIDDIKRKECILKKLTEIHEPNTVFLFQAGCMFSSWLIYNLHLLISQKFLIDMGRSLDYWCPNRRFSNEDLLRQPSLEKRFEDFQNQDWLKLTIQLNNKSNLKIY